MVLTIKCHVWHFKYKMNNQIDTVNKEIMNLLKKNNMTMTYELSFPIYKIIPDEVKLALSVLHRYGMKIVVLLKEIDDNKNKQ